MSDVDIFYDPPVNRPIYSSAQAAQASGMKLANLNFYAKTGALRRMLPMMRPGAWRKFAFCDALGLSVAEVAIRIGLPPAAAFDLAGDVARGQLRADDYVGSMVVSVAEAPGGIISRDFAKDADAVVSLLASRPAAVVVNVGRVRDAVLRRLQAMGLIGSGPLDGTLDEILTRPASPAVASSQKERAASPARKPRRKGPR